MQHRRVARHAQGANLVKCNAHLLAQLAANRGDLTTDDLTQGPDSMLIAVDDAAQDIGAKHLLLVHFTDDAQGLLAVVAEEIADDRRRPDIDSDAVAAGIERLQRRVVSRVVDGDLLIAAGPGHRHAAVTQDRGKAGQAHRVRRCAQQQALLLVHRADRAGDDHAALAAGVVAIAGEGGGDIRVLQYLQEIRAGGDLRDTLPPRVGNRNSGHTDCSFIFLSLLCRSQRQIRNRSYYNSPPR